MNANEGICGHLHIDEYDHLHICKYAKNHVGRHRCDEHHPTLLWAEPTSQL